MPKTREIEIKSHTQSLLVSPSDADQLESHRGSEDRSDFRVSLAGIS